MKSIWLEEKVNKLGKKLTSNIERDIVIVGGGISGVLCAYKLAQQGFKPTIIEAENILSGVTQNTTAHITAHQGYVYSNLSLPDAQLYLQSQLAGIKEFEDIIKKQNIACNFSRVDDYFFTLNEVKKIKKLYYVLNKIGAKVKYVPHGTLLGYKTNGYIKMEKQAMFNPIQFLKGLDLSNIEIFENTRVLEVDINKKTLHTSQYKISANKIIIATNYPIINLKGLYFIKLYKSQSYVAAFKNANKINGMYQCDKTNGVTFRDYKDYVIIGGLDHRTGRVDYNDKYNKMKEIAVRHLGSNSLTHFWSANDCITYDGVPLAGNFNKKHKDIFVITGFNKWGMANSMICSTIICDKILNKENKFSKIFCPSRVKFSLPAFITNIAVSVKNLIVKPIIPALNSHKTLAKGDGGIVNHKGKKAVYKDNNDNLHVNTPRCKHMGCELNFNPNTKSWDCPCHGSRFDIDGKIISGPSVHPLTNCTCSQDHKPNENKK